MTLAEIATHLEGSHGLRVALSTVWRFFERRGITLKKTAHASEQEQPNVARRRRAWFEAQPDLDPERLVFIDETGASTKMARHYGRSKRGTRCRAPIPHGHWKTTTFVGAPRLQGMTAPMVLDGAMHGAGAVGGATVLPKLRAKLDINRLVLLGALGTAAAMACLGAVHSQLVAAATALLAGASWITVLSSFQVSAQTALPNWARARAVAVPDGILRRHVGRHRAVGADGRESGCRRGIVDLFGWSGVGGGRHPSHPVGSKRR